jgi:hypothetical protein
MDALANKNRECDRWNSRNLAALLDLAAGHAAPISFVEPNAAVVHQANAAIDQAAAFVDLNAGEASAFTVEWFVKPGDNRRPPPGVDSISPKVTDTPLADAERCADHWRELLAALANTNRSEQ